MKKVNSSLGRISSGFGSLQRVVRTVIGSFVAGSIAKFVTTMIQASAEIYRLSKVTGVSTDSLQALQYAAGQADTDFRALTDGMSRLNKNMAEAARGVGDARDAFKLLGIDVQQLNKLSTDDALEVIAEQMLKITDESERAALAMKIFGLQGFQLLPFFDKGARGIKELKAEAARLGIILDEDLIKSMDDTADAWKRFTDAGLAGAKKIVGETGPVLLSLARFMETTLPTAVGKAINALGAFVEGVKDIGKGVAEVTEPDAIDRFFIGLGKQFANLAKFAFDPKINFFKPDAAKAMGDAMIALGADTEIVAAAQREAASAFAMSAEQTASLNEELKKGVIGDEAKAAATEKLRQQQKLLNDVISEGREALREGTLLADANVATLARLRAEFSAGRITASLFAEGVREAGEAYSDALGDRAREAIDAGMTSLQKLQREVVKLNELFDQLTPEQYAQRLATLSDEVGDAFEDTLKESDLLMVGHQKNLDKLWREYEAGVIGQEAFAEGVRRAGLELREAYGDRAKAAIEETRTPLDELNLVIEQQNELLALGAISADVRGKRIAAAARDANLALADMEKENREVMELLSEQVDAWADDAADAFLSFSETGKEAFTDLVDSILSDIARIIIQKTITDPLGEALAGALSSGGGFGSIFGGIFGRGGTGRPTVPPSTGGGGSSGAFLRGFATGGSFVVPPGGGVDGKLVQFMATPGEQVDITRAGQQGNTNITFAVTALDSKGVDALLMQRRPMFVQMVQEAFDKRNRKGLR